MAHALFTFVFSGFGAAAARMPSKSILRGCLSFFFSPSTLALSSSSSFLLSTSLFYAVAPLPIAPPAVPPAPADLSDLSHPLLVLLPSSLSFLFPDPTTLVLLQRPNSTNVGCANSATRRPAPLASSQRRAARYTRASPQRTYGHGQNEFKPGLSFSASLKSPDSTLFTILVRSGFRGAVARKISGDLRSG